MPARRVGAGSSAEGGAESAAGADPGAEAGAGREATRGGRRGAGAPGIGAGAGAGAGAGGRAAEQAAPDKAALRSRLLAARTLLTAEDIRQAAGALADEALRLPELAAAGTVAAYVSVGREPGTRDLIEALRARGVRVLLPVLLPDNDLDWAVHEGADRLVRARFGLLEPAGPGWARTPSWRRTRCCCRGSPWTGAACGWGGAAARTTACWPASRAQVRTRRSWCSSTRTRWSRGSLRNRTTTPSVPW